MGVVGRNTGGVAVVVSGKLGNGGRGAAGRPPGNERGWIGVTGSDVAWLVLVHIGLLRTGNFMRLGCRLNDGSGEKENLLLVDEREVDRGEVEGKELSGKL